MNNKKGSFIISLDFELFWGVCDHKSLEEFNIDIVGGRNAIPVLLDLFEKYNIHATWAVVGMLFAECKNEMKKFFPKLKPEYLNSKSPYKHFENIGENENEDCYHYAHSLIEEIMKHENQEIGSHTFSHYFCREKGQNIQTFEEDVIAVQGIAKEKFDLSLKSFVFPKNQFTKEYLTVLNKHGFIAVRGNQNDFAYNGNAFFKRVLRLVDTYVPVLGNKFYDKTDCFSDELVDVKSSIFFRKYNRRLWFLENIKLHNVKVQMKKAAQKGKNLHIWWHPHNMGKNPKIFIRQIEEILCYYKKLNIKYGFESKNMGEFAEELLNEKNCNVVYGM